MSRTILVTGGAGFIGTRTAAALLARGHRVRVLDNFDPLVHGAPGVRMPAVPEGCELVVGDVRDPGALAEALAGVDAVLHLAAMTGVSHSMFEIRRYVDVNVGGTAALWDAVVNGGFGVERVVLASSRAVYGEGAAACDGCAAVVHPEPRRPERLARGAWDATCPSCAGAVRPVPTPETVAPRPFSVYADTKLFQEALCRTAADTFGVSLGVLRYFNVFGAGQALENPYTGILPAFACRVAAGRPIPIYEDGEIVRDFVHVDDVAAANVRALEAAELPCGPVNVGSGEPVTVKELARALQRAMGVEEAFEYTGQYRAGDVRACFADARRAGGELGWRAAVGLAEGVREFVEWFATRGAAARSHDDAARDLESRGLISRPTAGGPR